MREAVPDPFDAELGARIKAVRLERGMSLATLAQAAGVSFQQIQKYEAGLYRVSASTLRRIAQRLEVTAGALFGEEAAAAPAGGHHLLLETPGALSLLIAFTRLRGPVARQALLRLAAAAADRPLTRAPEPRSFAAE